MRRRGSRRASAGGADARAGGAASLWALSNGVFNVEGGHRAIIFSRVNGIKSTVYAEGTHLCGAAGCCARSGAGGADACAVPWFERPIIYDVRAQPNIVQSTSGSRDLQMARASRAAPRWRPALTRLRR